MLRYLYLYLLICTEWSFCYDNIDRNPSGKVAKVGKLRKGPLRSRRQEYGRDPIAHIDIASFIHQPDPEYDSLDDNSLGRSQERERLANDNEYDSLSDTDAHTQHEGVPIAHNFDNTFALYSGKVGNFDSLLQKRYDADAPDDLNPLHKTEKKCSKKQMRFPFFSHKKTVTPKAKKNKKRKLFGFRSKTTTKSLPKINDPNSIMKGSHIGLKMMKRDALDRYCPLCKRKIVPKSKKKNERKNRAMPPKVIHNSRQYFQELSNQVKGKQYRESGLTDLDDKTCNRERSKRRQGDDRRKRDQDYDRERQLKELEDVQKKIDSVDITSPNFQMNRVGLNDN